MMNLFQNLHSLEQCKTKKKKTSSSFFFSLLNFKNSAKLARTAGVAFQVQSDLLEPEKTKLMNLISAIINFAKFTETTRETNDELRIEQVRKRKKEERKQT